SLRHTGVVVDRRMVVLKSEWLEAGPAHREVKPTAYHQHRIAYLLRIQPPPLHPPKQPVIRIDPCARRLVAGGPPVRMARHDKSVQLLERLTAGERIRRTT